MKSTGGSTEAVTVYGWSKSPTSTCTDKTAFAISAADNAYALPGFPITITPPTATAWDASTYSQAYAVNAVFSGACENVVVE